MSRSLFVLFLFLILTPTFDSSLAADPEQMLLVRFQAGVDEQTARLFLAKQNLHVVRRVPQLGVWVVEPESTSTEALVLLQEQQGQVLWAEPNGQVAAAAGQEEGYNNAGAGEPDDNYYQAAQGNLQLIGLPDAWQLSQGHSQPIAILDTGIDLDHPDLINKLWLNNGEVPENGLDDDNNGYVDDVHGWDFVYNDAEPQDDNGHGSHVAGIAGAQTNNGIGIAGVAWNTPLMAVKVLNHTRSGSWDAVAAGIVYAVDQGARVINLSLGGTESSLTIEAAVQYALNKDSLVVAAAGNGGDTVLFPAALPQTVAVGATDGNDWPWVYSNRGSRVDLAAPGLEIFSTDHTGSYYAGFGTSVATPHVSGVAALIWSVQPHLSAKEVQTILQITARDVYASGKDSATGYGRLDASAAVRHAYAPPLYLPMLFTPTP